MEITVLGMDLVLSDEDLTNLRRDGEVTVEFRERVDDSPTDEVWFQFLDHGNVGVMSFHHGSDILPGWDKTAKRLRG